MTWVLQLEILILGLTTAIGGIQKIYILIKVFFRPTYYIGVKSGKDYSWKNYFKLRAEIIYMQSKLQHHGEWGDSSKHN